MNFFAQIGSMLFGSGMTIALCLYLQGKPAHSPMRGTRWHDMMHVAGYNGVWIGQTVRMSENDWVHAGAICAECSELYDVQPIEDYAPTNERINPRVYRNIWYTDDAGKIRIRQN